jgi:hypothetical protein
MDQNFAIKTDAGIILIGCDPAIAEEIYGGICRTVAEYPDPVPEEWREENQKMRKLKLEIEKLLEKG